MNGSPKIQLWRADAAGAAGCVLLLLVGYYGLLCPLLVGQHRAQFDRVRMLELNRSSATAELSLRSLAAALASVQEATSHDVVQLRPAHELNRQMARINAVASAAGLDLQGCRIGQPVPATMYLMLPIHLTGRASFPQLLQFLNRLGNDCAGVGCTAVVLDESSLNGSSGSTTSGPSSVNFELDLRWFAMPSASTAEPPANGIASAGQ